MKKIILFCLVNLMTLNILATDNEKKLAKILNELKKWEDKDVECPSQRVFRAQQKKLNEDIQKIESVMSPEEIKRAEKLAIQLRARDQLKKDYRQLIVVQKSSVIVKQTVQTDSGDIE